MSLNTLRYPPRKEEKYLDELPLGFLSHFWDAAQVPEWFWPCDGTAISDAESPWNGQIMPNINNVAKTKSVTFSSGSTTATMSNTDDIVAGALVTTSAVPTGTKVLSINGSTQVTLSNSATASATQTTTIGGNGGIFLQGGVSAGTFSPDQMQRITGSMDANRFSTTLIHFIRSTAGAFGRSKLGKNNIDSLSGNELYAANLTFNSGDSPDARTSTDTWGETKPMSVTAPVYIKIKTLGNTKLITGYNVNGDNFKNFQQVPPESGDQGVMYDSSSSTYKSFGFGTDPAAVPTNADLDNNYNFANMPQVNGDPVVESGSNSDGEWTRWADGTQICISSKKLASYIPTSGDIIVWDYPKSFVGYREDHSSFLSGKYQVSSDAGKVTWGHRTSSNAPDETNRHTAQFHLRVLSSMGYEYRPTGFAIGRWK